MTDMKGLLRGGCYLEGMLTLWTARSTVQARRWPSLRLKSSPSLPCPPGGLPRGPGVPGLLFSPDGHFAYQQNRPCALCRNSFPLGFSPLQIYSCMQGGNC